MKWLSAVVIGISALLSSQGCSSSSDSSESKCWATEEECICGEKPANAMPFKGTCNDKAFSERAICCQGKTFCECYPIQCGISAIDGSCICGGLPLIDSRVGSCTGTASTCCRTSNYCYCEEGCQNHFESYLVDTCDTFEAAITCGIGQTEVSSCE